MRNRRNRTYRRRRKKGLGIFLEALCTVLVVAGLFFLKIDSSRAGLKEQGAAFGGSTSEQAEKVWDGTDLYSPYAILVNLTDGEVLMEKNSRERIFPASLTKMMTAILAVENTDDLDEVILMPESIFGNLYAEGASMAGFQPGEEAKLRDLLYGILLPSGAECCIAFAERIAGSEEAFVEIMNEKALDLGMNDTHFCNSTGLHEEEHYSTVRDMETLLSYALQNQEFRDAFTSSRHSVQPTAYHPEGFTFFSTLFQGMDDGTVFGGEILGGKTGYTEKAGLCLASLARVGEEEYVCVTAKAMGSHDTEPYHIWDAMKAYNQIGKLGI